MRQAIDWNCLSDVDTFARLGTLVRIPLRNFDGNGAPFTVSLWVKLAADAPQDNDPIGCHDTGYKRPAP